MSVRKNNIITYRDCVLAALFMQDKKRMHRNILPALTSRVVRYFRHKLVNGPIFGNKSLEHRTHVLLSLQLYLKCFSF